MDCEDRLETSALYSTVMKLKGKNNLKKTKKIKDNRTNTEENSKMSMRMEKKAKLELTQ